MYQLSRKYKQCGERFRVKCFAISHTNDVHWKYFYQPMHLSPNFTNFYHFLPPSIKIYYLPAVFTNFLSPFTIFYQLLLMFIPLFINEKWLYWFSLHLLKCTNPTILLEAMLKVSILWLFFFPCLVFVISTIPGYKSIMDDKFRIIIVEIVVIKSNIINVSINKIW